MTAADDLVRFRLSRAREALDEARLLAERAHWNTCLNRLYYACFYAATALLAQRGLASSKHAGVRSLLHQHFVKVGEVPVEMGRLYDQLFEARQEGDYVDFVAFQEEDVRPNMPAAEQFVALVEQLLPQPRDQDT